MFGKQHTLKQLSVGIAIAAALAVIAVLPAAASTRGGATPASAWPSWPVCFCSWCCCCSVARGAAPKRAIA